MSRQPSGGRWLVIVVLVFSGAFVGCLEQSPSGQPDATDTRTVQTSTPAALDKPDDGSHIESRLYQLATANDSAAFAREHDITIENGTVRVAVELRANRSLPEDGWLNVETRTDDQVLAWVPIDRLVSLSNCENITFVRTPVRLQTNK